MGKKVDQNKSKTQGRSAKASAKTAVDTKALTKFL